MNIISQNHIGMKDHFKVFDVVKNGGFISLSNNFGLHIELHNGYATYSLVAIGKEIDNNVLFNMDNQRFKKEKVVKQEVVSSVEKIEDEDLFN